MKTPESGARPCDLAPSPPMTRVPSRPVTTDDYDSWPDRWKLEGFNSCWRRAYEALEALAGAAHDGTLPSARSMSQIAYQMKLTERVLEQRFRVQGNTLLGESPVESMERRLFTMPTETEAHIVAVQAFAQSLIDDVEAVSSMSQSQRGLAFLRTVHCLATDIDGPGFEMWNEYEQLVEIDRTGRDDDGKAWQEHWAWPGDHADSFWGGAAGVFERDDVAGALGRYFLRRPEDGHCSAPSTAPGGR